MKKYYLGVEERYSMTGHSISKLYLLVERSSVEAVRSVYEYMLIVSKYGNFEADIEFRFESNATFHVVNRADGKQMGQGTCIGPYDSPSSMVDTITIEQTKEKAIAVFSFDGPRIFVGKTYYSLDSSSQTGFAIEKCLEIEKQQYDRLKTSPQDLDSDWQKIRFN